jgi:hypothetical protein
VTAQIRYGMASDDKPLRKLTKEKGTAMSSFEKEIYDLSRNAFLKHYFQASLGQMSGILVAYHNTQEMFGLHFFTRERLAEFICGSPAFMEDVYHCSLGAMEFIIEHILNDFGNSSAALMFMIGTRGKDSGTLHVIVEDLSKRNPGLLSLETLRQKYERITLNQNHCDGKVSTEEGNRLLMLHSK